nr:MAG TPA: hypothetical protein [Caudoviricetes sp.]
MAISKSNDTTERKSEMVFILDLEAFFSWSSGISVHRDSNCSLISGGKTTEPFSALARISYLSNSISSHLKLDKSFHVKFFASSHVIASSSPFFITRPWRDPVSTV